MWDFRWVQVHHILCPIQCCISRPIAGHKQVLKSKQTERNSCKPYHNNILNNCEKYVRDEITDKIVTVWVTLVEYRSAMVRVRQNLANGKCGSPLSNCCWIRVSVNIFYIKPLLLLAECIRLKPSWELAVSASTYSVINSTKFGSRLEVSQFFHILIILSVTVYLCIQIFVYFWILQVNSVSLFCFDYILKFKQGRILKLISGLTCKRNVYS